MRKLVIVLTVFILMRSINVSAQSLMNIKIDNVSISVPEGWSAQYTNSLTVFVLFSPIEENDSFQENANLTIEKLQVKCTEKEYLKACRGLISTMYSDFELVEEGNNYHVISGIFNGKDVMQLQFVSIKKNTAYIMTYTSDVDNFARYFDIFKSIQKTFKY